MKLPQHLSQRRLRNRSFGTRLSAQLVQRRQRGSQVLGRRAGRHDRQNTQSVRQIGLLSERQRICLQPDSSDDENVCRHTRYFPENHVSRTISNTDPKFQRSRHNTVCGAEGVTGFRFQSRTASHVRLLRRRVSLDRRQRQSSNLARLQRDRRTRPSRSRDVRATTLHAGESPRVRRRRNCYK